MRREQLSVATTCKTKEKKKSKGQYACAGEIFQIQIDPSVSKTEWEEMKVGNWAVVKIGHKSVLNFLIQFINTNKKNVYKRTR